MKEIFLQEDAIISPLGFSTQENLEAVRTGRSGLLFHEHKRFSQGGLYAGIINPVKLADEFSSIGDPTKFTKLEQMMLLAIHKVFTSNLLIDITTTGLIISTTKGNIDLLSGDHNFEKDRFTLSSLADIIKDFFQFKSKPILVSNACMSGGLAVILAKRFIQAGKFNSAIVVAGDLVSDFVISGFQSLQALSNLPCRPFSKNRNGISIGEAAAAIYVSNQINRSSNVSVIGDSTANDANHISGPSRSGDGLFLSISNSLKEASIPAEQIDYISAHGTATIYNDEMEAVAFDRSGLINTSVNSYKGLYGHTLGASALIETIISKHSLLNNELYNSYNFEELGVSVPLNIIQKSEKKELKYALKTASGFGGCNMAIVLKKSDNA